MPTINKGLRNCNFGCLNLCCGASKRDDKISKENTACFFLFWSIHSLLLGSQLVRTVAVSVCVNSQLVIDILRVVD